jgi:hypothetical protein
MPRLVPFAEAIFEMEEGDLLLYRADATPVDGAIAKGGRSDYCHAAKIARTLDEWRILEMVQGHGGREISLMDAVKRNPGRWDVYETNPDGMFRRYDSYKAVQKMRSFIDRKYGWVHLIAAALQHMPIVRWFMPSPTEDASHNGHPPFCSEAVAISDCDGGIDPVPNLADRFTEPGDLARSLFYRYRFTLIP